MPSTGTVRRAEVADADELVRLRAVMYDSFGTDTTGPWQQACLLELRQRLAETEDFAAFVVDRPPGPSRPGGPLVSAGVGWVERHLPSPRNTAGRRGHVASMSTDVAVRGQGYGSAVLAALLGWLTGLGLTRVDLRATVDGEPLYRASGFTLSTGLPMSWTAPDATPDACPTPSPLTGARRSRR